MASGQKSDFGAILGGFWRGGAPKMEEQLEKSSPKQQARKTSISMWWKNHIFGSQSCVAVIKVLLLGVGLRNARGRGEDYRRG